MSLSFRSLDHANEASIRQDLFRRSFPETLGTDVETDTHYHWKFRDTPFTPRSYEFGAYDGEDLAGYYAALPYRYAIDGKERSTVLVCDVMTDPERRGQGIFTKVGAFSLEELKKQGVQCTFGYPIRPEVIPGHLKVGWKIAFELPLYIRWRSAKSVLGLKGLSGFSAVTDPVLSVANSIVGPWKKGGYQMDLLTPVELFRRIDYQSFLNAWSSDKSRYLVKEEDFLLWRLSAPNTNYKILVVSQNDLPVALSILRVTDLKGISSLAVLDLMVLPNAFSCLPHLHQALLNIAGDFSCDVVTTMMSRTWASRYRLYRNGYMPAPFVFKLILNALDASLAETICDEEKWHLMWIDSDDL